MTTMSEKTRSLTARAYAMLVEANGCSLPGDGLRIKGSGQHRVARSLEALGFVRVAVPGDGRKAHVHVTQEGRAAREHLAQVFMGASAAPSTR